MNGKTALEWNYIITTTAWLAMLHDGGYQPVDGSKRMTSTQKELQFGNTKTPQRTKVNTMVGTWFRQFLLSVPLNQKQVYDLQSGHAGGFGGQTCVFGHHQPQ